MPAVGKSGPCTNFKMSGSVGAGIVHQRDGGVDDLGEVVRRNFCRHADGDAVRAIHQQVGNARGQHVGFDFAVVVVGTEIDGVFIEVFQQSRRHLRKLRFGITIGRWRIAIDRSEVSLAEYQRIAQAPRSAPGEPTRRTPRGCRADGTCPSPRRRSWRTYACSLGSEPHLLHGVENAAMHWLQSVTNIGQRAADDDRHRVVEIRPPHLLFDIDGLQCSARPGCRLRREEEVKGSSGFWDRQAWKRRSWFRAACLWLKISVNGCNLRWLVIGYYTISEAFFGPVGGFDRSHAGGRGRKAGVLRLRCEFASLITTPIRMTVIGPGSAAEEEHDNPF